tara:strand:+ start:57 stop:773 length:717 start_codon:yes stop_codon:yes gene_type:complete
MENLNNKSGIIVVATPLTAARATMFVVSKYKKDKFVTVRLEQEYKIEKTYPSSKLGDSLNDNIFSMSDFKAENKTYDYKSKRSVLMTIPKYKEITAEDGTKSKVEMNLELVQEQIDELWANKRGFIYEIKSFEPVLSDEQIQSMTEGRNTKTMDEYANQQVYRMSDKAEENAGAIILNQEGMPSYRVQNFTLEYKEDILKEAETDEDVYVTKEILSEIDPDFVDESADNNALGDSLMG